MNTELSATIPAMMAFDSKQAAPLKKKFKTVPENCKVLSATKFRKVVSDLESVLLDISADGVRINAPDGRVSVSKLNSWAEHLRDALETLSKGQ